MVCCLEACGFISCCLVVGLVVGDFGAVCLADCDASVLGSCFVEDVGGCDLDLVAIGGRGGRGEVSWPS